MRESEWASLPLAIRRRFSKRLPAGGTTVYAGEVLETAMSRAGWWLAQALRLIGGPLPTHAQRHVPSVVTVTEDQASGGQIWTRIYGRRAASRRSCIRPSASRARPGLRNMSATASA